MYLTHPVVNDNCTCTVQGMYVHNVSTCSLHMVNVHVWYLLTSWITTAGVTPIFFQ